jgi:hypothetical protein
MTGLFPGGGRDTKYTIMMNGQNLATVENILMRVYKLLKFNSDEAKNALNGLAGTQQLAISAELLGSVTEDEVEVLNDAMQKNDGEKRIAIEQIAKAHENDGDFKFRARVAAKKVLDEHIAYLKTRGDEGQKAEIAKILAEIG